MPKIEFKSAAKPSLYAYPPPMEEKKAEEREKVATAVLSIAARQKRRETADKKDDDKMEIDEDVKEVLKEAKESASGEGKEVEKATPVAVEKDEKKKEKSKDAAATGAASTSTATGAAAAATTDEAKDGAAAVVKPVKEPEPNFEILSNPARVLRQQLKAISIVDGQSYVPLKDVTIGGIVVTQRNVKPGDVDEVLVEPIAACGPKNDDAKEPEAPEPFEYIED